MDGAVGIIKIDWVVGALRSDYLIIRVSDVGLTGASLDGAPSSFGGVDGLEEYFVGLGHVPTIANPCSRLRVYPSQLPLLTLAAAILRLVLLRTD